MASTQSPSPSPREDPPAEFLTPRSKIKQLLATVESSSDEESTPRRKASSKNAREVMSHRAAAMSATASEDDEDDVIRPRGKFASRMLARSKQPQAATPEAKEDPMERVKRILQQGRERAEDEQRAENVEMVDANSPAEEDVVAPRLRKLMQRRRRSKTPETNLDRAGSPGLFVSPPRAESPGLFVTPSKAQLPGTRADAETSASDSELPTNPLKNPRVLAHLERKRKEREAREAEEARKQEARLERATADDFISEDDDNITDDEGGRKLTQEPARPSRKASRKALEDMNRETQRINRSLQLAHEAKTKKKITKSALFERFNFRPEGGNLPSAPEKLSSSSRPSTPVSVLHTDGEAKDPETPPSSPPVGKPAEVSSEHTAGTPPLAPFVAPGDNTTVSALNPALENAAPKESGDKGKMVDIPAFSDKEMAKDGQQPKTSARFSARFSAIQANWVTLDEEDEDELEIIPPARKTRLDAIFDRVPLNRAKESRPLQALRALAQLDAPDKKPTTLHGKKKSSKPSMTPADLDAFIIQRSREQAKQERERRLEMLKAKGIHVQTAEEREREMAQVEDIVARARQEAEEIMQREREEAKQSKRDRKAAGEVDPLAWDDSDEDGSYAEEEPEALELSGSDEEMGTGEEDEDEEVAHQDGLIDDVAESTDGSNDDEDIRPGAPDSDDEAVPAMKPSRLSRKNVVLSDDEDGGEVEATPRPKTSVPKSPVAPNTDSPRVPTSVLRSATKTFIPGLPIAGAAAGGLGLTQIFAGTMDDSQGGPIPSGSILAEPRPTFDDFPDSNFSQTAQEKSEDMILDSQPNPPSQATQDPDTQGVKVNLEFSQSQQHGFDSLLRQDSQLSEMIEPSQDKGFVGRTPLVNRFVELSSTVETVAAGSQAPGNEEASDSPLVKRAGKLRRRVEAAAPELSSGTDSKNTAGPMDVDDPEEDEFGFGTVKNTATAFGIMKDAAKTERKRAKLEEFNKKKSKAREMVEEQAEESEDEYAGLGGADGEDSDEDDDASVKEMLDDETKDTEADERMIAALHADRERAADEKQVDKLFRDITSGMLRRKRRGSFGSLSDSDDGGEARRRMKRRQFAKMQKALFADERVSKVAENPRTQAFMRSIQDIGSDDEMDFILPPTVTVPATQESQSQGSQSGAVVEQNRAEVTIPDSQPVRGAPRLPAAQRRTKTDRKPANIGEIRESLSNLLEISGHGSPFSSDSVIPKTVAGSDGEADNDCEEDNRGSSNKENKNPRRTNRAAVVDRISLKRNTSSELSTNGGNGRLAFAAQSAGGSGGFRVPALLRRATTNSLMSTSSTSSTGVTTNNGRGEVHGADGAFGAETKMKKNASKRSGINYFARENERRAALAEKDKRREAKKMNRAEGRGKIVGGLFGAGKFE